jgi:dGTPase
MRFSRERELSPFAVDHRASRGRLISEPKSPTRTEFQRDRDRIIHSTAFRRLKHKTQVFVEHEGDHYRTRLTHTIEVSQIARALARTLGLDEDLAEALALAHDLGHTPFGHAGEDALAEIMAGQGGFDHNAQALRIVTRLERRYATYDGLNLSWETLEGLVKHNGPLIGADGKPTARYQKLGIPEPFLEYDQLFPLDLATHASAEAQVAAIADDIAYNAHDIDDGLRARLFQPEDLRAVPLIAEMLDEIGAKHPGLEEGRVAHEIMRRVITRFIEDAGAEAERRLVALEPNSAADVRNAAEAVVAFSPAMATAEKALKAFLFEKMYRHPRLNRLRAAAGDIIRDLFARYREQPDEMGIAAVPENDPAKQARRIADYIAGMTDRFAVFEHQRLFDVTPSLR